MKETEEKLEHETKRPAWQTSAFWVPILVAILPVIENLLKLLPPESGLYILGTMILAAAYSFSRNMVYKSRNDASAAVEVARIASAPDPFAEVARTGETLANDFLASQSLPIALDLSKGELVYAG